MVTSDADTHISGTLPSRLPVAVAMEIRCERQASDACQLVRSAGAEMLSATPRTADYQMCEHIALMCSVTLSIHTLCHFSYCRGMVIIVQWSWRVIKSPALFDHHAVGYPPFAETRPARGVFLFMAVALLQVIAFGNAICYSRSRLILTCLIRTPRYS